MEVVGTHRSIIIFTARVNHLNVGLVIHVCVLALISYVLLIPVSNNLILFPAICLLGLAAGAQIIRKKVLPPKELILPGVLWLIFIGAGTLTAIIRQAEYWPRTLVFFLFWPIVYAVITVGFNQRLIKPIFYIGAIITGMIGVFFLIQGLAAAGYLPFTKLPSFISVPVSLKFYRDTDEMITLSSHALPPLIWWGAMWIASLFCDSKHQYLPPMWLRLFAATAAISGALVSWRRGLILALFAAPFLILLVLVVLRFRNSRGKAAETAFPEKTPKITIGAVIRVAVVFIIGFAATFPVQPQVFSMLQAGASSVISIVTGEDSSLDPNDLNSGKKLTVNEDDRLADEIRKQEVAMLLRTESPADLLVGHGFGAKFDRREFERPMRPWQTELQYHGLYNWTGFVGLGLVIATGITSAGALRRAYSQTDNLKDVLFIASVGAAAVLLANGSNPYLQAPGHMWPVFFPLMIACVVFQPRTAISTQDPDPLYVSKTP